MTLPFGRDMRIPDASSFPVQHIKRTGTRRGSGEDAHGIIGIIVIIIVCIITTTAAIIVAIIIAIIVATFASVAQIRRHS